MPRRLQELDKTTSAFQMDLNTVKHSLRDLPAEVAEQLAALVEGWVPYLAARRCFKAPASPCSFLGVGWVQDMPGSTREQRTASRHCLSRAYLWVTMQVMACSAHRYRFSSVSDPDALSGQHALKHCVKDPGCTSSRVCSLAHEHHTSGSELCAQVNQQGSKGDTAGRPSGSHDFGCRHSSIICSCRSGSR